MSRSSREKVFSPIGASNHSKLERHKDDYYATEPKAVELLLEQESFSNNIWEPACGEGHMSEVLKANGYNVLSTDLVYRGYGEKESVNFLGSNTDLLNDEALEKHKKNFDGDIITNPPYKFALEFVKAALDTVREGHKVAMFLKLTFLEGKARKIFFETNPPYRVYVSSSRIICAKDGEFKKYKATAIAYAWFVWVKGYKGDPIIKWIN